VLSEFGGREGRRDGAAVLPSGIAGAYALATDPRVRARVAEALRLGYSQDLAILGGDLLTGGERRDRRARKSDAWCLPRYAVRAPGAKSAEAPGETKLWAMRHPTLADGGRPNPAALARSILVTGPNAAGKTTYMKALAANLLLAQTFGIVCAARAEVAPVDMFGSFVRVGDSVGVASLFQAEVARCRELCADAAAVSAAGGRAVLFLDEPMHSTPPTEGAATAVAVAKYLIALPGVRVVVTSHFAVMADIARELPALMANVCVRAELRAAGGGAGGGPPYSFTYRVQQGASFQSIALEMLEAEALPAEVVAGAVQMVNKICGKGVSN
jgi:DNA mismatch repair protein MutS